ncbi:hypothetical protein GEMRC1_002879 [Eukaryota sp. GEM-RC1]
MSEPPLKLSRSSEDSLSVHGSTCILPSNSCSSSSILHNSNSCSYHLQFQQSLLTLILSHYLRRLSKTSSEFNHCRPRRSLRRLTEQLPSFIKKVGYVSQRFFQSSLPAVKLLFQSNTFAVVPKDLPFLSSIASFFGGEMPYVFLCVDKFFKVEDILEYTSIVSDVLMLPNYCDSYESDESDCDEVSDCDEESDSQSDLYDYDDDDDNLHYLLDDSSPLFLPRLRRLDIFAGSSEMSFSSLFNSLSTNTIVIELNVQIDSLTTCEAKSLTELFYSNNTLRKFSLTCESRVNDEKCRSLFTSLSKNRGLTKIDLSGFDTKGSAILPPPLNSSGLKSIGFPSGCYFDSLEMNSHHNNSSVTELSFPIHLHNSNELTTVLNLYCSLKKWR